MTATRARTNTGERAMLKPLQRRERLQEETWKWEIKNRIEYNTLMKTYWVRVTLLGKRLLFHREMKMNCSPLTLERKSLQWLFRTLPYQPPEMRLQVDVSSCLLSAVSACFFSSHTHTLLVTSLPISFPVKVFTPDKRVEWKHPYDPCGKKTDRKKREKMERGKRQISKAIN